MSIQYISDAAENIFKKSVWNCTMEMESGNSEVLNITEVGLNSSVTFADLYPRTLFALTRTQNHGNSADSFYYKFITGYAPLYGTYAKPIQRIVEELEGAKREGYYAYYSKFRVIWDDLHDPA